MVVVTLAFGVLCIHFSSKYKSATSTPTCKSSVLNDLIYANAVFDLIAGPIMLVILTYGVATTKDQMLEWVTVKLINVLRIGYSFTVSLGIMTAITVVYFKSDCSHLLELSTDYFRFIVAYWSFTSAGVISAVAGYVILLVNYLSANTESVHSRFN
ncbi:hypothetical protein AKO1_015867 [Acrasis kona]|uniref:3 TM domain-containing transmembrane protein n=1 Tax=Acrasis kona TaxID=1008807 RepID=A0AAW2ZHU7_9EUKA